jgi:DNA repair exonuclease SbcCD ATPase subunit
MTKDNTMRIQRIRIRNVLGIEEIEFEPGRITQITGRNASGKSSIVEALKAALGGGSDATLLRQGADDGEVVLVLDDGAEIRRRITADKQSLTVKHPELGAIGAGQTYLNRLQDTLGLNPVELLTAPPSKRAEFVMEALPLRVTADELREALQLGEDSGDELGSKIAGMLSVAEANHALTVIAGVRRAVYDARTGVNRAVKEKRITAQQLTEAIGEADQDPEGIKETLAEVRAEAEEAHKEFEEARLTVIAHFQDQVDEAVAVCNAEIEAARGRLEQVKDIARLERDRSLEEVIAGWGRETYAVMLADLESQLQAASRAAQSRETRDRLAEDAVVAEREAITLSAALDRLDALKARLLEESPLDVEIGEDGEIYRDGVPFSRLNKAQQVDIAMQLAILRAGKLPLVCVDGLEVLDRESYEAFLERARQEDVQLIVTRVSDDDLVVAEAA